MNSSYKVHIVSAVLLLLASLPSLIFAQTSDTLSSEKGFLSISSNYDSLYVIIDRDFGTIQKLGENEILDIDSGKHTITIVPEFTPFFTFEETILPDTVLITRINFTQILDNQTSIYKRIMLEDSTLKNFNWESKNTNRSFSTSHKSFKNYFESEVQTEANAWIKIKTNVDSVYIRNNFTQKRRQVIKIANGDSISIRPGNRLIEISHPKSEEWRTTKKIGTGKTTTIHHNFKLTETSFKTLTNNFAIIPYYQSNLFIVTDNDSEIYVDDIFIGTGAAMLNRKTGPAKVVIKNPYRGADTYTPKITNLPNEDGVVINAYTKPDRLLNRIIGVVPGASQLYKHQKLKSAIIGGGFLIFGGLALQRNNLYHEKLSEFKNLRNAYNNATDEQTAFELGNELDKIHNIVTKRDNERYIFFTLTSLLYAFNIYDALFDSPESGFRSDTNIEFYFQKNSISNKTSTSMTLRYAF
ncbi:DUF5683 domain-containing protein [Gracilimonas sp.]|uniref:DUF5683 domain-containing protein n=1 Tax=Gracilimonas sp. TaxID=1974203 RepID=UPI003BA8C443